MGMWRRRIAQPLVLGTNNFVGASPTMPTFFINKRYSSLYENYNRTLVWIF